MPTFAKDEGALEQGRARYLAQLAEMVRRSAPPRAIAKPSPSINDGRSLGEQPSGPRRVAAVEAALADLFVRSH